MELKVVHYPHKALLTKAEPVTEFNKDLKDLVEGMYKLMTKEGGIGLSANQVDVLKRVIVVNIPSLAKITLVNPVITQVDGKDRNTEGCLSFPGIFQFVERPKKISVKFQDTDGNHHELKDIEGLAAICIQHEIDHLDGIVFTKRMGRLAADMTLKKMNKLNSKYILNT